MKRLNPILLTIARVLSVCLALSVLGYLVYCAHRDARKEAPDNPESRQPVFLPSSKAAPAPLPSEIRPTPNQLSPLEKPKNKKQRKKKKQPDIFIPSSKSGVMRLPSPVQNERVARAPAKTD